jgi:putative photosynthetic complex assembly protein
MSHPYADKPVPRAAILAAAALIGFSLVLVAVVRLTGEEVSIRPDVPVLESRALHFDDATDGTVAVREAGGEVVHRLAVGEGGFVRATLRGLARERLQLGLDAGAPFLVVHYANGQVLLEDPETGRAIDLRAFGETNLAAFARYLDTLGTGGTGGAAG